MTDELSLVVGQQESNYIQINRREKNRLIYYYHSHIFFTFFLFFLYLSDFRNTQN